MYMGKNHKKAALEAQQKKNQTVKAEIQKNQQQIKQINESFKNNMNEFAKKYKNQIFSDSKFRDKFSQMCQQFDINPMLSQKTVWTELGFGDFYHHLAIQILDICNKSKHQNGGIMKIDQIKNKYNQKQNNKISKNDIIRATQKLYMLGNVSIIDKQYVSTMPLQMNTYLSELLSIAEQHGFISAKLLNKMKKWSNQQFQTRIMDLRRKGILWIDKKVPNQPHYYFLSHLGTDFKQFVKFMQQC